MQCEKCGHLQTGKIKMPWLYSRYLAGPGFDKVSGVKDDVRFTTLFISKTAQVSLLELLTISEEEQKEYLPKKAQQIMDEVIDPLFVKLQGLGIEIIGELTHPTYIRMAITDLMQPFAVFWFITVKDTPFLKEKLEANGLGLLLTGEGMTDTIGNNKFAV